MKLIDIYRELGNAEKYGRSVGWLANVIFTRGYAQRKTMLSGLLKLAKEERVTPASFSTDDCIVDGRHIALSKLADFA